ncbi:MAG: AAC(3) family N-acetyltransferase [Selenomonas sp.]|uniref:AAC(3) family N-acetyltransferase n=1 Tax=Selenomonas sp. TaxID=2053611 RepID=UPI0025DFF112|nr:AAC(3) family N-acetyltransferase [Selenomonas sp.]MCR5439594.1 AAC(3) family N-acetyltransferase [Selenomonas sp.]
MEYLFSDNEGIKYDEDSVYHALRKVGADDCETLFLHSDLMFGQVPESFNRKKYVKAFANAIYRLKVRYLIVPTFTYSFCNHEVYDVKKSKTSMGILNEYFRKEPKRFRTCDPLLSLSVPMELKSSFENVSEHSLGTGSGLDILHKMENVKFLLLGARFYDCFTYLHYVEKILEVPYRYDQSFIGTIIDEDGNSFQKKQYIHTNCKGVTLREDARFEDYLTEKGILKKNSLGNSFVSCISETDAYREIVDAIENDPMYFLAKPYRREDLRQEYTYDVSKGRITHC